MSSLNRGMLETARTYEGARSPRTTNKIKLARLVLSSMLFEDTFYVDGVAHYEVVKALVPTVPVEFVENLAISARNHYNLRHIPLVLVRELARAGKLKASVLEAVIQRPDEMGEFLAHYWKEGKQPLSHQVRKGLAAAFCKFNEYQLAKWDKNSATISVRDIMFLTHPKPVGEEQEALFKRVANNKLVTPDTWEVALSGGADKRDTFMRLINESKLGAMAFIRNLRNMVQSNVPEDLITQYGERLSVDKVLPYRFIAAAKEAPEFEGLLERMMFAACVNRPNIYGKTVILVDVSGSMDSPMSSKSSMTYLDAASAVAVICREICPSVVTYTFSDECVCVPNRRGMAYADAITLSQPHSGTLLDRAIRKINSIVDYDRIIVITDEQSYDEPSDPKGIGYIINIASYQNGIGNSKWTTINGFSGAVLDYIQAYEKMLETGE